ncbi:fatty acid desaturase [Oricola sp.]|uniref:fatty acid desaturase n=1 Tax=Oricola sp. TaxID=1979950 RepID=UPI003BA9B1A5
MMDFKMIEWPTLAMLGLCYGVWAGSGFLIFPDFPVLALALMAVSAALHASLQHEVLHGHPTRNAAFNELLVALPLCAAYPYRRFKQLHLRHHNDERLTDPYDDPESWYRAAASYRRMGAPLRLVLRVNNTLVGRIVFGPALAVAAFFIDDLPRLWRGERGVRRAWAYHAAGLAGLVFIVQGLMGIGFLTYLAFAAYGGLAIISIRTYCEHRWAGDPDGRTLIVEKGGVLGLLFLNNHLHLVHHKLPAEPWYALPALYRAQREAWHRRNGGYVFRSYWAIARAFAFRAKEPVVHPAWRQADESVRNDRVGVTPAVHAGPQVGCQAPSGSELARG